MSTATTSNNFCILLLLAAALLLTGTPARAEASDEQRASMTRQIPQGGRGAADTGEIRHSYPALNRQGQRSARGHQKTGAGAVASQSASNDFWFYRADVVLFNDDDRDGYYHGIDLLFDADTWYDVADVYAAVFLSYEGGPWNEYAVTDDFSLYGATSDDEYVIVTELETGYPAGSYDILIELYDALDGAFLASYGPEDTSELAYLPLEDFQRDAPVVEEVVVIGHGGGGAAAALALLPLLRLRRRFVARRLGPAS